jgi:hypothetical protein
MIEVSYVYAQRGDGSLTPEASRGITYLRFLLVMAMTAALLPWIGVTPSAAQQTEPTTRHLRVELLKADFIYATDTIGHYEWLGVNTARYTNTDTGRVWIKGSAFRGTCEGDNTGLNTSCNGERANKWELTRFQAGNGMEAGLVVLKNGASTSRLRFNGGSRWHDEDQTYENHCGGLTTDIFKVQRYAKVYGRLLGRRVSTRTEAEGNRAVETMWIIDRTETCT